MRFTLNEVSTSTKLIMQNDSLFRCSCLLPPQFLLFFSSLLAAAALALARLTTCDYVDDHDDDDGKVSSKVNRGRKNVK